MYIVVVSGERLDVPYLFLSHEMVFVHAVLLGSLRCFRL